MAQIEGNRPSLPQEENIEACKFVFVSAMIMWFCAWIRARWRQTWERTSLVTTGWVRELHSWVCWSSLGGVSLPPVCNLHNLASLAYFTNITLSCYMSMSQVVDMSTMAKLSESSPIANGNVRWQRERSVEMMRKHCVCVEECWLSALYVQMKQQQHQLYHLCQWLSLAIFKCLLTLTC